jgi:hypothetical protein
MFLKINHTACKIVLLKVNTFIKICIIYLVFVSYLVSRGSAVGIATAYSLDDRGVGVRVPVVSEFSLLHIVQPALESTQPPIQWVPRTFSPGVKRQGHEADHSPPNSAEVKEMCIHYPI